MSLKVLIVDDEAAGRLAVRSHCESDPRLTVIGECSSGREAIQRIGTLRPDIVFLDISMRPVSGLDVAQTLEPADTPAIVFVTAYDEYAVRAFDLNAVDYLLKPVCQERFSTAVQRVSERIGHTLTAAVRAELAATVQRAVRELRAGSEAAQGGRLLVESDGEAVFVEPREIEYVEAHRNYVELQAGNRRHVVRSALGDIERRLTDPCFLRIHRSVIVNTSRIRSMQRSFHGEYVVEMAGGRTFTSGRTYRRKLQEILLRGKRSRES